MAINKELMSSSTVEWETPQDFFDMLDAEFHFTLDAAATEQNAKCDRYYTKVDDALTKPWTGIVWCNPPYGRVIGKFVAKAYEEAQRGAVVVMLIPTRTDTRYWHEYVMRAKEIRLVKGRLYFTNGDQCGPAPFPSAVIVFGPGEGQPSLVSIACCASTRGAD